MTGVKRTLLAKTRRDLRRRSAQFAAIAVTVLIGVTLFISSYDAYRNLAASYDRTYAQLRFADLTASGGDPDKVAAAARDAAGVAATAVRTQAEVPLRIGDDKLVGRVVGLPADRPAAVNRVEVTEGRGLGSGGSGDDGVLLEKHAAGTFGLGPGDTLRAYDGKRWRSLTVRGVVISPEYLWPARNRQEVLADPHSFAVVFAAEDTARRLAGPQAHRQTLVRLTGSARDDGTAGEVAERLRRAGAVSVTDREDQPSNAVLREDLKGFQQLAVAFPLLFLSAAAVAAYVLITRLVLAERKVIATFLAAGAHRSAVVRHYLGHGLLAGTAGAAAGVALGIAGTAAVTHAYTSALGIPHTAVQTRPAVVVAGLAFGVLVGLAGGIAPALSASRTAPAEAMRGDAGTQKPPGRVSRAVAGARWLPLVLRMSLRELARSRRRTLATMTGTVLSLVLVLSTVGMTTSMNALVDAQFGTVMKQDATVRTGPGAEGLAGRLRSVAHVADVEAITQADVTVSAGDLSYDTSLTGYEPDTRMHGFRTGDGGTRQLPAHGVLAGSALTGRLDVAVGDRLTVRTSGGRTRHVRLAGLVHEPMGTALYGTKDTVAALTGTSGNAYQLRFAAGTGEAARDAARAEISGLPGVVTYTDERALHRQLDDFLSLFWIFTGVMLVLGGLLALTVIYVTMTVNVAERTVELATLRAGGVRLRRIAGVLAVENLTATALALPVGLAAGAAGAAMSLRAFSSDMFTMELSLGWEVLAAAAVSVLAASLLSQLPAVRMVRGLDIARVVRERAQ
ncbi:FtsX-like permease family protein [Streptomyces sp. MAR4 CNX-425]|uniref:FtsX-like permease family protein n=1 Tax=Streptomyces sp. MAR4 CNX-425 TaxID=3406343 RepID=UPI003B50E3F2